MAVDSPAPGDSDDPVVSATCAAIVLPNHGRVPASPCAGARVVERIVKVLKRTVGGMRIALGFAPFLSVIGSLVVLAAPAQAQDAPLAPPKIGAGMRASFVHNDPEDADSSDRFVLDSARLYISGAASQKVSFMFNSEYNGATNDVGVLDAVAQFAFSPKFNVWVGRFLPPSDRANLYGPYYANHWAVYTDGVQDGYPFVFQGRDNGAMYWGQFGKVKVAGGAFDGSSATGDDTVIGAGRVQVDFWDAEDGYYLNGTYYGDKNLLAIGGAGQVQGGDRNAYNVDFLLERKVSTGGAFTIEAEWAKLRRARRIQRAVQHQRRRLRAGQLPVSGGRRHRPVPGARQVRPRAVP